MAEVKASKKTDNTNNNKAAQERAKLAAIKETEKAIVDAEAQEIIEEAASHTKGTAKAGKRSAKALKDAEEKTAKKARRDDDALAAPTKPKHPQNPPKSQLERKGKQYRKLAEQIDRSKQYSLKEGLLLATKTNPAKFDATVELHVNLQVDPRHADQNLRDTVVLPSGTGKSVRIAVFADETAAKAAKTAGADIAGEETIITMLDKAKLDFDVLIAQPQLMAKLGKYARVLGPKGLMPNPKSGTVSADVVKAVQEAKAGRVEYRVDSTGIVHVGIGKVSFGPDKLGANARAVLASLKQAKPSSVKGNYVQSIYLTSSMGPSINVVPAELLQ